MPLKKFLYTACLVALPSFASSATVTLEVDQGWTRFGFDTFQEGAKWYSNPHVQDVAVSNADFVEFRFTLLKSAVLQVTDGWLVGDQFEVYSNDELLGETSAPVVITETTKTSEIMAFGNKADDWDSAFRDPLWSSGAWLLDAGNYTITGSVTEQLMRGSGAVRLISPVPLPASSVLMLSAFGAWFGFARRRNRKAGGAA